MLAFCWEIIAVESVDCFFFLVGKVGKGCLNVTGRKFLNSS